MDPNAKRGVKHVTAEWQLPEILDSLAKALTGSGPALRFAEHANPFLDSVPENIAVVVATSGSTGKAKEIGLSSAALLASARASNDYLGAASGDSWSLLLPLTHIAGVNVLVRSLELGREPIDLRHATPDHLPTADFTAIVPTQLHRAIHESDYLLRHFQSAHRVLVGGARLDPDLRANATDAQIRLTATYGMSESSGGCVYDGMPLPGVEIELREGRVAIKGEMLASYYLPTSAGDQITAIADSDGWYLTNDLGYFEGERLVVTGRIDDVINSGGEKISLRTIEEFLTPLLDGEVVAFTQPDAEWGERLMIATTVKIDLDHWQELQARIRTALGRHAIPQDIYRVAEIPKSALGKVDREGLLRALMTENSSEESR
jgi:O-succinylbenzoic acid--CoA ligase